MRDPVQDELVRLGGGDPFAAVLQQSEAHRVDHDCGLFPAGPAVMQLASSFVRAANARSLLDLGCGIGYSTFWLAAASGPRSHVIGVDSDESHIDLARTLRDELGFGSRVEFVLGNVVDVISEMSGPIDAVHDDAWFATAPLHSETMLDLLRPGGLLTMPNWFLLVDALSGEPRDRWDRFSGPRWAAESRGYAELLAGRDDISVSWIVQPPLGVAIKKL